MSHPPQAPYQQPYAPVTPPYAPPRKGSGLAVASMVLGIIALLLSWVPVVNNVAAVLALVGLGLAVPALLRVRRGTHGGKGLAITGLVTSLVAIVLVVVTQIFYASVIDEVERTLEEGVADVPADSVPPELAPPATGEQTAPAADVVPIGSAAQVGDYQVVVDAVALDADAAVAAANQFNEPPTGRYVTVQLSVTYTGATEGMPGWDLTSVFHGTDARQYSDMDCMASLADDAMNAPTLNPGGADTFQFCMDVPPAAIPGGQLSIEPTVSLDADERVFFAVQ